MARKKEHAEVGIVRKIKRGFYGVLFTSAAVLIGITLATSPDGESDPSSNAAADCKPTKDPVGAECTAQKAGQYLLVMHDLIYESVQAEPGDTFNLAVDRSGREIECDPRKPKTYTIEFAPGPADESVVMYTYDFC